MRDDARPTVFVHAGDRGQLRSLFELAEDSTAQLDAYLEQGTVLVAACDGEVVGHLQLVTAKPGVLEIKNMAVRPSHQRRGVGAALVAAALVAARGGRNPLVQVATAAADTGNLRFYQRLGFRMREIERDAFTEATGYPPGSEVNGIALRDRVWLDRRP
jgi:predicted N-acetyltransferase YhbS